MGNGEKYMDKVDPLKQMSDAIDLLQMLEQLTDGLSRADAQTPKKNNQLPWAGMRLTLNQARQLLLFSYEKFFQSAQYEPQPAVVRQLEVQNGQHENRGMPAVRNGASRPVATSLADRVQPVPGRVRDLTSNGSGLPRDKQNRSVLPLNKQSPANLVGNE